MANSQARVTDSHISVPAYNGSDNEEQQISSYQIQGIARDETLLILEQVGPSIGSSKPSYARIDGLCQGCR